MLRWSKNKLLNLYGKKSFSLLAVSLCKFLHNSLTFYITASQHFETFSTGNTIRRALPMLKPEENSSIIEETSYFKKNVCAELIFGPTIQVMHI